MAQPNHSDASKLQSLALGGTDAEQMLDLLLALDRMLVEVSMRLYNVPRRDRRTMRKQNRRLHAAVKQHLPRLLSPSAGKQ